MGKVQPEILYWIRCKQAVPAATGCGKKGEPAGNGKGLLSLLQPAICLLLEVASYVCRCRPLTFATSYTAILQMHAQAQLLALLSVNDWCEGSGGASRASSSAIAFAEVRCA